MTNALTDIQADLVADNLGLVYHQAKRFRKLPTYEDILSAGLEGLCMAVAKWDPERGALSTYSHLWIKAGMQKELRRQREITEVVSESMRKIEATEQGLMVKNITLTNEIVTETSGVDLQVVEEARGWRQPLSMDYEMNTAERPVTLHDITGEPDDLVGVEVRELLSTIRSEDARAIAWDLIGYNNVEAAVIEGCSKDTVRNRKLRGMVELKKKHA